MKKLLLTIVFIVILAAPLCAGTFAVGGIPATETACNTKVSFATSIEDYASDVFQIGTASGTRYASSMFVAEETADICKVCTYTKSNTGADPGFNVTAYLYSNNTTPTPDQPNAVITNGTFETKDMTGNLTGTWQWMCWDYVGTKPTITSGQTYHAVFYTSAVTTGSYMYLGKDGTCATENAHRAATDLIWMPVSSTQCQMLQLYK
jgi:hypothetical protein